VSASLQAHKRVNLPGANWARSSHTIILGLSTGCRFCEASLPFYRALSEYANENQDRLQVIALFPQQAAESTAFLRGAGVAVSDVRQVELGAIGIHLTPTLVMTDQQGTITNLWLGQLTASQATEVWSILKRGKMLSSGSEFVPAHIGAADLERLRAEGKEIKIVDIRSRNDYAKDARAGTVNIPFDELPVRARIELSKHELIVISCRAIPPVFCDFAAGDLTQGGFPGVAILAETAAK
jgi:uncharacterized membrane protein YeaQ/YmgE (transglycosylase-associated protein family)